MTLRYWLPPVIWMALIAWFSTGMWTSDHTQAMLVPLLSWLVPSATPTQVLTLHAFVRKLAHLTEYAVLAALWFRAFALGAGLSHTSSTIGALSITVSWAGLDEFHQIFVPGRTPSAWDVLIDSTGAFLALVAGLCDWRSSTEAATATFLWIAALGGAALVAVNAGIGVGAGTLWLTVPAASLVLVALKLRRGTD